MSKAAARAGETGIYLSIVGFGEKNLNRRVHRGDTEVNLTFRRASGDSRGRSLARWFVFFLRVEVREVRATCCGRSRLQDDSNRFAIRRQGLRRLRGGLL